MTARIPGRGGGHVRHMDEADLRDVGVDMRSAPSIWLQVPE
jgi:hypothetical protein